MPKIGIQPLNLDCAQNRHMLKSMDVRDRVSNIRQLQLALGLRSYARLHEVLKGQRQPSPRLALQIELATGGAIKRWELRPDLWGATAA